MNTSHLVLDNNRFLKVYYKGSGKKGLCNSGLMVCSKLAWCTLLELDSSMLGVKHKLSPVLHIRSRACSREIHKCHPACSRKESSS